MKKQSEHLNTVCHIETCQLLYAPYAWGPKHNQAFDNIKREIV